MLFIWTCMQMDDDQHNEFGSEISEEDDVQEKIGRASCRERV